MPSPDAGAKHWTNDTQPESHCFKAFLAITVGALCRGDDLVVRVPDSCQSTTIFCKIYACKQSCCPQGKAFVRPEKVKIRKGNPANATNGLKYFRIQL